MLRKLGLGAVLTLLAFLLMASVIPAKVTKLSGLYVCDGDCPTANTSDGVGDVLVEGTLESDGAADLDSTLTVAGAATLASTLDVTGVTTLSAGVDAGTLAAHIERIRFCGNGPDGATAQYMGPVLLDDTEADLAYGGAGCDALDSATEATADAPWHAGLAFKPVAMVCVGQCTGATAANDAVVYQLRDDTADVTGMTCTSAAFGGDDTPSQCTVRDTTPATVAAGSTVAIEITATDDDCNDVGDDFECLLYVTF